VAFEDRYLDKRNTPNSHKSNVKRNPLFVDVRAMEEAEDEKKKTKPSWTVREYDTQTIHGNLADYLKVICGFRPFHIVYGCLPTTDP